MRAFLGALVVLAGCAAPGDASEGTLVVRAHDWGVVHVDARPSEPGEQRIARGQHVVELRRGALVIASALVEVRAGQRVLVDLDGAQAGAIAADASVSGRVSVESVPPGALVEIDGVQVGLGPVAIDLVPGPHSVRVSSPGFETYEEEIYVGAGAVHELRISLRALQIP